MRREQAEMIAARALGWLATNGELMPVFLASTGSIAEDLRAQSDNPAFLISILDFLAMDDARIIGFCDAEDLPYEAPMQARQALPGGADIHWT